MQLQTKDQLVTLTINEVYTAKQIKYPNGTFVGLNDPVNLLLIKDVVCLVPVQKLDPTRLRYWFDKVIKALHDILYVVAVSVDNHVSNR